LLSIVPSGGAARTTELDVVCPPRGAYHDCITQEFTGEVFTWTIKRAETVLPNEETDIDLVFSGQDDPQYEDRVSLISQGSQMLQRSSKRRRK
jgi:hypothetical protein